MDRNYCVGNIPLHIVGSLSARRAWIEIMSNAHGILTYKRVALRKESVDRNLGIVGFVQLIQLSLSARRAWIEIGITP